MPRTPAEIQTQNAGTQETDPAFLRSHFNPGDLGVLAVFISRRVNPVENAVVPI
jgi:hypothetical protein